MRMRILFRTLQPFWFPATLSAGYAWRIRPGSGPEQLQVPIFLSPRKEKRSDRIESYTVFLADIVKNAYVVTVEFFTATIPMNDFNAVRQQVNLSVIALMESMQIRLSSKDGAKEAAQ